jgi:hypothetical protein
VLGDQAAHLLSELCDELVVGIGDQRTSVEREVGRRDGVDRAANDVRDDDVAAVDRVVVGGLRDLPDPRGQREQRRVAREVGGGTRGRLGETPRLAGGQPRPGEPEGENLIGVYCDRCGWSGCADSARRITPG